MRNWWIAICIGPVLAASSAAQTGSPETSAEVPRAAPLVLSGGTGVVAELTKTLNAKNAKVGDTVQAIVAQDVLSHGRVVIRAGSKLIGHLTQVKASSKEDPASRLGIAFEKVALKGGEEMPLDAVVRALGPPTKKTSRVDQPDQMLPPGLVGPGAGNAPPAPMGRTASGSLGGRATNPGTGSVSAPNSNAGRGNVDLPVNMGAPKGTGQDNIRLLSPQSRGVFWLPGLRISAGANKDCVVSAATENVKLESESQVVLEANGPAGN